MGDVERRIETAFDFLRATLDNPELLELLPNEAVIGLGDDKDAAFTKRSGKLLSAPRFARHPGSASASEEEVPTKEVPHVMLIRTGEQAKAHSSQLQYRVVREPLTEVLPADYQIGRNGAKVLTWHRLEDLRGRTLSTVTELRQFEVDAVDDNYVTVIPRGGRGHRRIRRSEFEETYRLYQAGMELVPSALGKYGLVTRNSSYVVAILRAALGINP
jgi:hypothetical protein